MWEKGLVKIREILGLPVIYSDGSKSPGFLKDIIINVNEKQVKAFVVEKTGLKKNKTIFGFEDIHDVGAGALIAKKIPDTKRYENEKYEENYHVNKKFSDIDKKKYEIKVYSKDGDDLGFVKDIFFNLQTGYIEAFELSDGLIDDIIGGRKIIPLIGKYEFGEENIVVGTEAVEEMTNLRSKIGRRIVE